jgi:hypothetical protein
MKEATGELNSAIIVVIVVGLLIAFFYGLIWPMIKEGLKDNARCADAVCDVGVESGTVGVECYSPHDKSKEKEYFYCPYKG